MKDNTFLDYNKIIQTIEKLEMRISERFPQADLQQVCHDFLDLSKTSKKAIEWIDKPNIWLRILTYGIISIALIGIIYSILIIDLPMDKFSIINIVSMLETIVNETILLGAAIFFLITIENRIKRSRAIKSLNKFRALAHVVDMHQLTKDPHMINEVCHQDTNNSPDRTFTKFELQRYLDYCSEMLSLIKTVAR